MHTAIGRWLSMWTSFFVYPFCDTRPIRALTDWLDGSAIRAFSAMLVDMYPKGPIDRQIYQEGQDPMEIAHWFDSGNYVMSKNPEYLNLWIQGGPRARVFFAEDPDSAPSLNKIPLVKWHRSYVYANSTHMLLPRGLNLVYDDIGGEKASKSRWVWAVSAESEEPGHAAAPNGRFPGRSRFERSISDSSTPLFGSVGAHGLAI